MQVAWTVQRCTLWDCCPSCHQRTTVLRQQTRQTTVMMEWHRDYMLHQVALIGDDFCSTTSNTCIFKHQPRTTTKYLALKMMKLIEARSPPPQTTILRSFSWDDPGEPVPELNFWTLWCKGRLTEADTPTIGMGATPSGLVTSAHLHHPHIFYRPDALPAAQPTASKHRRQLVHLD